MDNIEEFRKQLIVELEQTEVAGDYTGGNAEEGSWWESDAEATKERLIEIVRSFTLRNG